MAFKEIVSPGKGSWRESAAPGERIRSGITASAADMVIIGDDVAQYLSKGMYFDSACALAGIVSRTAQNWVRKGKGDFEAQLDTPEAEFYEKVQWGLAKFEELMHDKLDSAAKNDPKAWGATAFRLERRLPERYGKVDKNKVEVSGAMGVGIATLPGNLAARLDSPEKVDAAKAIGGILSTLGANGRPVSVRDDSDGWQGSSSAAFDSTESASD